MKKHFWKSVCVFWIAALLLSSCAAPAPEQKTAPAEEEKPGTLVTKKGGEEIAFSSEWASALVRLPETWRYELKKRGNEEISLRFWPDGRDEGVMSVDLTADFSLCCVELEEEEIEIGGLAARRGAIDGAEKWTFVVFRDAFPGKCSVMNRAADTWFSAYEAEAEAILQSIRVSEGTAKKDSFELVWNVYGISSYDSRSGKLVKTTDATFPAEYVTEYLLSDEDLVRFLSAIKGLDLESYPDEYDPDPDLSATPPEWLVLTLHTSSGSKTVACRDLAFGQEGTDAKGKAFLSVCREISGFLMETDAWKALPDYEFLYQ